MLRLTKRSKTGLPPGTMVFVGKEKTKPVQITLLDYHGEGVEELTLASVEAAFPLKDTPTVSWINLDGVHDLDLVRALGSHFCLHPLVLEDIVNTTQRPKVEEYEDYLYIVFHMLYFNEATRELRTEQVSLVVGPNYVMSFLEDPGDLFDPVRERLRTGKGRIRYRGPSYLAYALLDMVVDHYFTVLDTLSGMTERLEDEILENPTRGTQHQINDLRRELVFMRRAVWPVRELLLTLERTDSPLIDPETRPFFRDAYDHSVQVIDIVESLRDLLAMLTDLYMSSLSNRMNEIMKFLTVVGTIFIPLTFIAGVYGMNFRYMPELESPYGYPFALLLMFAVAAGLILFFRYKRWL